jgi:Fatty acid/phospholipid biosynthesis enzyme
MVSDPITIAIDVMGGDNSPLKTIEGVNFFLKKNKHTKVILLGDEKLIINTINSKKFDFHNYEIINTTENISNEDTASDILKKQKK